MDPNLTNSPDRFPPQKVVIGFKVDPATTPPVFSPRTEPPQPSALGRAMQAMAPQFKAHQDKLADIQQNITRLRDDLKIAEITPVRHLGKKMRASEQLDLLKEELVRLENADIREERYLNGLTQKAQPEGLGLKKKKYLSARNKAIEQAARNLESIRAEKEKCKKAIEVNEIVTKRAVLEQELRKLSKEKDFKPKS